MREKITTSLRSEAELRQNRNRRPLTGDFDLNPMMLDWVDSDQSLKAAAVLVPIIEREEPTVLLTKRTDHLHHHAGQVSFPGGRVEPEDVDLVATALRETEEEIGLAREFVDIAGYLDDYQTGTGFHITPVVGFVRPGFELDLDDFEVAEAFEVPLSFLFDPANHHRHARVWQGKERRYYAMPYGDHYIWGATAGMLINLYRRIHDGDPAGAAPS
jgi:8-oxo-dGTP pyrophosphatase MutT (NUDIX family)